MKIIILVILLLSLQVQAKLLDKILAIADESIITMSQLTRIHKNLNSRRTISPIIYSKSKYSKRALAELLIQRILIRNKLSEIGYIISDERVEIQIKETEKNLGVNRDYLLDFLRSNNITFDEYFEIIRETLEFNIFHSKIIRPLISITEQEVKNRYYRKNISNKTLAFKYTLADFSLPTRQVNKSMLKQFKSIMIKFHQNGILNEQFRQVQSNLINEITEDGLSKSLTKLLKKTDEGSFSNPIKLSNRYHIFYVKKKDLVESEQFTKAKERIRAQIFQEQSDKMISLWYKREQDKHYIRYFF